MKNLVPFVLALAALFASQLASATVLTFTDRTAFENYVGTVTTDDFEDMTTAGFQNGMSRTGYSWDMDSFRCVNDPGSCGNNEADGFFYKYIWTYENGSFSFDNAISAFGLDFDKYSSGSATISLNGISHTVSGSGFLGFVDTASTFTSVAYTATGSGSLFDNVTFSSSVTGVPAPAGLLLIGLGLLGLRATRRV